MDPYIVKLLWFLDKFLHIKNFFFLQNKNTTTSMFVEFQFIPQEAQNVLNSATELENSNKYRINQVSIVLTLTSHNLKKTVLILKGKNK